MPPQSKRLACGDTGVGAMADVGSIVAAVKGILRGETKGERLRRLLVSKAKAVYDDREVREKRES